jgi:hypothetical protein
MVELVGRGHLGEDRGADANEHWGSLDSDFTQHRDQQRRLILAIGIAIVKRGLTRAWYPATLADLDPHVANVALHESAESLHLLDGGGASRGECGRLLADELTGRRREVKGPPDALCDREPVQVMILPR